VVVLIPGIAYFAVGRALPDMFDAVVRFNSVYIQATPKARLDSILEGFKLLSPSGLPVFSITAWSMATLRMVSAGGRSQESPLVNLAVIALPIELLMVGISGRSINHYFIAWLPICAVLSARFFQHVLGSSVVDQSKPRTGSDPRYAWAVGLAAVMLLLPLRRLLPPFFYLLNNGARDAFTDAADLAQYEEQYLLMWGAESTFNFLTGKPSPTKYVFQYPLYTCGYVTDEMAERFRREVVSRRPLIVDSSIANPAVPPINVDERRAWSEGTDNCALTAPMLELLSYIDANYGLVGRLSYTGWPIYGVSD